jgi:hypothetical protein
MENHPLFWRRVGVVQHASLVDEEGRAKVGPNLGEQNASARKQFRHFIRRLQN